MSEQNYANVQQQAELMKYISDNMKIPVLGAGGGFAPIGTINSYMGTVAPIGWLVCDGTVYNIADYPDLATHIASQFGSTNFFGGNGTTTFGVPDLRGEFLRGSGTNSHENQGSGANVGVHQDGTQHNIMYQGSSQAVYIQDPKDSNKQFCANPDSRISINGTYIPFSRSASGTSTGYPSITSRPTNTSVLFIVKATLSDAELNAFNVYTPREHQVGWWEEEIDGVWKRKPVYERTIRGTSPSTSGELTTGITNASKAGLVSCYIDGLHGYTLNIAYEGNTVDIKTDASTIYFNFTNSVFTSKPFRATIQYTKTTDDWQTS